MLHEAIYSLLVSLASGKVYPGIAKENEKLPYIVHFQIDTDPSPDSDGVSKLDRYRYQVSCFAGSYREVQTLGDQVRTVLDEFKGVVSDVNISSIRYLTENYIYEDTNVHHIPIDFEVAILKLR
jgi:hypothetical protein